MQIRRFEDVKTWQEARQLTRMVYQMTAQRAFAKDLGLASQIQRAAISTMSNIAEGFDSGSPTEFVRFLGYVRRSASEVQCHLYAALDQGYIGQTEFDAAYAQAERTRKMTSAFTRYLRSTRDLANRPTRQLVNPSTRQPANSLTHSHA